MDRAHRHDLKHDKFVERVGSTVDYATEHKQQVAKWGGAVAIVLLLVVGWVYYSRHQAGVRQAEMRKAIEAQQANVGPGATAFLASYPTEEAKAGAVRKIWSDLAARYPGTKEAMVAEFYMGVNAVDKGNIPEAEKHFKTVSDSGDDIYGSQAKLSLAQLFSSTGRDGDAEKLLRGLMEKPTIMVSKEQATIALARVLAKSKPAEARKLLEPLRTERSAISRTAITLLGEIPAR